MLPGSLAGLREPRGHCCLRVWCFFALMYKRLIFCEGEIYKDNRRTDYLARVDSGVSKLYGKPFRLSTTILSLRAP
jgi:hypothetical protein